MKLKFTGRTYKCPKCGAEIDGYWESCWRTPKGVIYNGTRPDEDTDENNDEFIWIEYAGCEKCLDAWDVRSLKDITKVKVSFD